LRGEPITGATYIREKFGPVPRQIMPIRAELKREGYIKVFEEGGLVRITADAKPDMSAFTKDELQTIDYWIEHIDKDHTAGSISDASHDYAWDIARMGEELPFYAILANRIRDPSNQESERFQTIAKAQGAL
jgi:Antitoxin SocA-like, Panacea domain